MQFLRKREHFKSKVFDSEVNMKQVFLSGGSLLLSSKILQSTGGLKQFPYVDFLELLKL